MTIQDYGFNGYDEALAGEYPLLPPRPGDGPGKEAVPHRHRHGRKDRRGNFPAVGDFVLKLSTENAYAEDAISYLAAKEKKFKEIAKYNKKNDKR